MNADEAKNLTPFQIELLHEIQKIRWALEALKED